MKTYALSTEILLIILLATRPVAAQNDTKEQLLVPLSNSGKPGTLHVGLINGSIHVTGYTGKDVIIDAVSEGRGDKKDDGRGNDQAANGMKRISMSNSLDVSAEEHNNTVTVNANTMKNPVNLTIKVPQQFSLKVSTINNGEIVVENVNGELEVNNVNGAIQLNNVAGSAVANTVNGAVKVTFKTVTAEAPMAFSTLNGNVDVTFPATAKMTVKLKSDQGDIYTDFDIDMDKSQPKVNRSAQNGMYRVNVDDWVQGKVNGGGREIMMKNMHGNIYIRKAR